MADRPVIFSAPMVRALLAGGKTQTRRPRTRWSIGDRLWVREAWNASAEFDHLPPRELPVGCSRAFGADGAQLAGVGAGVLPCRMRTLGRDRASIHLPRWMTRATLTVTAIREQRLQEISEEDAEAEGVDHFAETFDVPWRGLSRADRIQKTLVRFGSARRAYRHLWEDLHGAEAWGANPCVAAITFTVDPRNIDERADSAFTIAQAAADQTLVMP